MYDETEEDRTEESAAQNQARSDRPVQEVLVGHTGQYWTRDKGPYAAVVILVHADRSFDLQVTLPSRTKSRHFFYAEDVPALRTPESFHWFVRL